MRSLFGWLLLLGGLAAPPPRGGIVSSVIMPPSVAKTLPAGRAQRQGRAKTAGAKRAPASSRRLGSAITWAILGALYYISGGAARGAAPASPPGSWWAP